MAIPADHAEKNSTPSTANCPARCIGRDAGAPDKPDDYLYEAAPALVSCIALEVHYR